MLFKLMLICCFTVVTSSYDQLVEHFGEKYLYRGNDTILKRYPREDPKSAVRFSRYTCDDFTDTSSTPFVILLVYKTAGRFLGMGSLISAKTVLTAKRVVSISMPETSHLLAVAGSLSPWWGKGSQVKEAEEIFVHENGLALVNVRGDFVITKNVAPIKLIDKDEEDYREAYTLDNAVFGIYRGSWDIPGDATAKNIRYYMQVETIRDTSNTLMECKFFYKDEDFDEKIHFCTSANATFCWGCIGSPSIGVANGDYLMQIGVITKTTLLTQKDKFHIHTKIGPHVLWLKGHSHLSYPEK